MCTVCVFRSAAESLSNVCLHVAEVTSDSRHRSLLPEYNCLQLSPAWFWNHDKQRYLCHCSYYLHVLCQHETVCFVLGLDVNVGCKSIVGKEQHVLSYSLLFSSVTELNSNNQISDHSFGASCHYATVLLR